ncbi:MAG: hypothetical protein A3H32_02955 [Betaproteobacteria bacterium RIFCSPLOWO2_02_FULL_63_19]|nr:MAG: hypothetical protein A3H32_02955 [Betaproteobacteria bacterium RIFCSPLOWO2_02_FULL_63_19]
MTSELRRRLGALSFLIGCVGPGLAAEPAPRVAGLVEKVVIGRPGVQFEAKLDTGADISSIDATHVTRSQRDGRTWMDFTVARSDGSRVKLSGRLIRHMRVRRSGAATIRRPVVALELCLGPVSRTVEVGLANRDGLDYDLLVGTNFLKGYFMVDPMRTHVLTPKCTGEAGK